MTQIKYLISGKLKNGDSFNQKEYYVYAENEKDAKDRIELCLDNDEKIMEWKIENKIKIKNNEKKDKEHMVGVWYEPYDLS